MIRWGTGNRWLGEVTKSTLEPWKFGPWLTMWPGKFPLAAEWESLEGAGQKVSQFSC